MSLRALLEQKVSKTSDQQGDRDGWRGERVSLRALLEQKVSKASVEIDRERERRMGERGIEEGEGVTQSCAGTEGEQDEYSAGR